MSNRAAAYEAGDYSDHGATMRGRSSFDKDDAPAHKRQRTALACNSCRYRKSRCDGAHPICSTCRSQDLECIYRGPAPRPQQHSQETQSLEKRFQQFESNIQNINSKFSRLEDLLTSLASKQSASHESDLSTAVRLTIPPNPGLPSNLISAIPGNSFSNGPQSSANDAQQSSSKVHRDKPMSRLWPVTMQEDTVDGMGSIIFADESNSGFFGPSSNSALVSKIAKALESGLGPMREARDFSRDLGGKLSRPASPPAQSKALQNPVSPYILPSRSEIFRLIDIFFSYTGQSFPYISRSVLREVVGGLDSNRLSGMRKSALCLLNAILAMGTSLDGTRGRQAKNRDIESDVFFQRALFLSPWTISNTANLETLQALTVMTQYLQGSSRSAQTWKLHGLLVQAAFQLGVYTKDSTTKLSAFEQEIRTRIWYTCIILDRIFATTFGRPPLIHNQLTHVMMPRDVELDELPKDCPDYDMPLGSNIDPSSCILFNPSIRLYCIQGDILAKVYDENKLSCQHLPSHDLFSRTIELDQQLEQWKLTLHPLTTLLPLELLDRMDPDNWVYTKIQTVLTLRFLSTRTLLFRKSLEHALDAMVNSGDVLRPAECSLPIGNIIIQGCIECCVQTITIICKLGSKTQYLPAWWYTAYYVFNSALILFGVICLQTAGNTSIGTRPAAELLVSLQTGLDALDIIGKETRIVRRCSKYLKKMLQVSKVLVRNHFPAQSIGADVSTLINSLPAIREPSTTDGSEPSPFQTEFGPILIDEDYAFLDAWSDINFQIPGQNQN